MKRLRKRAGALAAAAVLLASCSSPFEPVEMIGEFRALDLIGYTTTTDEATLRVVEAKVLVDASTVWRSWWVERIMTQSGAVDTLRFQQSMTYTIDGRRLDTRPPVCRGVCALVVQDTPDYLVVADLLVELDGRGEPSVTYTRFWSPETD